MKKEPNLGSRVMLLQFLSSVITIVIITNCFCFPSCCYGAAVDGDVTVMLDLKKLLNVPDDLGWSDTDPCNWKLVGCSSDNRISRIQIGRQGLKGTLPSNLGNLTGLQRFEAQYNEISGPLPSLSGLNLLQVLWLSSNNFTDVPVDFFSGMTSLQSVTMDNNPFKAWVIPDSLRSASSLQNFSANSANITGNIPDLLGGGDNGVVGLTNLHLAFNSLEGGLPLTFVGSTIQVVWLNGQSGSKLSGTLDVVKNMTSLRQAWLHSNNFSGPLPYLGGLTDLEDLSLRDNWLTGPVPASLISLPSLKVLNLTNNLFQGPTPKFADSVDVDMIEGRNSFCLDDPGVACDSRVDILLSVAHDVGYPTNFARNWKGNDPCNSWLGITCDRSKNITSIIWLRMGLTGTISPRLSELSTLQVLILANNSLTGTIPTELTKLPHLRTLDVSFNQLYGDRPSFRTDVVIKDEGNVKMGSSPSPPEPSQGSPSGLPSTDEGKHKSNYKYIVAGILVGFIACIIISAYIYINKKKTSGTVQSVKKIVIHPHHSGDQDTVKITVASSSINGGGSETNYSLGCSGSSDVHNIETGNLVISIQVLRNVTNNFSEENILGRGGFGTVYKGELHDGTKIAVKRMECGSVGEKGLHEFKSEIAVLTKVRHRHLVALLGYCLDGNEKLLVYEYMPQGDLSTHLFNWKKKGLEPLEWMRRLSIALDVARAVEYLHGLARECFIHRDLKPSNILLSDEMRAKVADFGLVRLAPEGKASFATKLAGTFGYLAPEYAVTGRVTTKVDVFSFGVILMELITGRKALDETQPEESLHLVNWFRRMSIKKDTFEGAIDNTITLNEETLASISTISELAGHCTAREPSQRPDMGHVVNVISSLVELWKPADPDSESLYGIDLEMSLPQAVKKWQAFEGHSNIDASSSSIASFVASNDNTETSIPIHPPAFADSFTSEDGR